MDALTTTRGLAVTLATLPYPTLRTHRATPGFRQRIEGLRLARDLRILLHKKTPLVRGTMQLYR